MAESLSISEATEFLECVLQIHFPLEKLKEDRVSFLNDIISAFLQKIPFQSVMAIATPKPERRKSTFGEIKVRMMKRQGGLCSEMNQYMKVLLETLGYQAHHVSCDAMGIPQNHLITVVQSLCKPGDHFMVDVGIGYPMFHAIPLDFERESPIYQTGFFIHRFVKEDDGTIRWMHTALKENRTALETENLIDGWYTFMVFKIVFRDIEYFAENMQLARTVESGPKALSPFLRSLRAVDFHDGRLFAIKDTTVLEEDSSGKVNKKRVSGPEELLALYKTYFPQFSTEMVQRAMQTISLKFEN